MIPDAQHRRGRQVTPVQKPRISRMGKVLEMKEGSLCTHPEDSRRFNRNTFSIRGIREILGSKWLFKVHARLHFAPLVP